MAHIGLLLGAILVATASFSGTAAAQERQLGSDGDVTFSIPVQYRCGTTAPVTVTTPDPSLFTQDQARLQRLLGLIRIALGFECPTVSTIEVSGVVRGRHVYSGIATAADDWRLASTQDTSTQPVLTERELVRDVQQQLNALGYDAGPDDGLMGSRTRNALSAFQRDKGLSASATPDPQTMAALSQAMQARLSGPTRRQPAGSRSRPITQTATTSAEPVPGPVPLSRSADGKSDLRHTLSAVPTGLRAFNTNTSLGMTYLDGVPVFTDPGIASGAPRHDFSRFFDLLALKVRPDLLDAEPTRTDHVLLIARAFLAEDKALEYLARGHTHFAGANEFEREDTRQAFIDTFREPLRRWGPSTPLVFALSEARGLPEFDQERGGFPLTGTHSSPESHYSDGIGVKWWATSRRLGHFLEPRGGDHTRSQRFGHFLAPRGDDHTLSPLFWEMNAADARQVLSRLATDLRPDGRVRGGRTVRLVTYFEAVEIDHQLTLTLRRLHTDIYDFELRERLHRFPATGSSPIPLSAQVRSPLDGGALESLSPERRGAIQAEADLVRKICENNRTYAGVHDCECSVDRFVEERLARGPDVHYTTIWQDIITGEISRECFSVSGATSHFYDYCLNSPIASQLRLELSVSELEDYCRCFARTMVRSYNEAPSLRQRNLVRMYTSVFREVSDMRPGDRRECAGDPIPIHQGTAQPRDEEAPALVPDTPSHLPMTNARLAYLALHGRTDVLEEARLLGLAQQQIVREQSCFAEIEKIAATEDQQSRLRLNPNLPIVTPTWQSINQEPNHPDRRALLDVFLSPESDWSIATGAQGYDARFRHMVDAFIFDPEAIRGRDPRFLARELLPLFRSHLDAALDEAAPQDRLQAVFPLPSVAYDFENNALRFKGSGPDSFLTRANLIPPADSQLETAVEGFSYDPLSQPYRQPSFESRNPGYAYNCSRSGPTHHWRTRLNEVTSESFRSALVFQEDLGISSIPMETAEAEQLLSQLKHGGEGISARVFFHVESVKVLDGDRVSTALFRSVLERVEVLAPDGQVLVQLKPADFQTAEDIAAATAERDAPRVPALQSVPTTLVPDAETLDLLTVRFLPEAVTDSMLERMMLARWEYERQMHRAKVSRAWGDFFLRQGDEGLVLLDRPDRAQRTEMLPPFRQWTLERADSLATELTFRFAVTNLKPGILGLPSSISVDRRNLINSHNADCRRGVTTEMAMGNQLAAERQARECDRMDAARAIPQSSIEYINPFRPDIIGPRVVCGAAVAGQDHYCAGATAALNEVGDDDARLIDIFALDRLVEIIDEDVAAASAGVIELTTRVEGVSLAGELPPTAWDRLTGHTRKRRPQGATDMHLWSLAALSARLVDRDSGATIRELALVMPPSLPDDAPDDAVESGETAIAPTMATGGPDVLGIHLGMHFPEAERIIRDHMDVGRILFADRARDVSVATGNIRPFTSGRLYVSADSRELIVLYDEPPAAEGVVVGVARQTLLPKGQASPLAVFGSLRNKYGPEDLIRSGMMATDLLVWGDRRVFNERNTSQTCLPIMARHQAVRSMWVDSEAKAPDWRNDQALANGAFPGLDSTRYGEGAGAGEYMKDCPRGVAALFQPGSERAAWDSLQVWLFDPQGYAPLIRESARLLESGHTGGHDEAEITIDLKL